MEDGIDVLRRARQAGAVAHVAHEEPHVRTRAQPLALVEVLRLVAPEDSDDLGARRDQRVDERRADGAGAAGDEHAAPAYRLEVLDGTVPPPLQPAPSK